MDQISRQTLEEIARVVPFEDLPSLRLSELQSISTTLREIYVQETDSLGTEIECRTVSSAKSQPWAYNNVSPVC